MVLLQKWCHADRLAQAGKYLVLPKGRRRYGDRLAETRELMVLPEGKRRYGDRLAEAGRHLVLPEGKRRYGDRLAEAGRHLVLPEADGAMATGWRGLAANATISTAMENGGPASIGKYK